MITPRRNTTQDLTPRETAVYWLIVRDAKTMEEIGSDLGISVETVRKHTTAIFDKTGVGTRLELAVRHYTQRQPDMGAEARTVELRLAYCRRLLERCEKVLEQLDKSGIMRDEIAVCDAVTM